VTLAVGRVEAIVAVRGPVCPGVKEAVSNARGQLTPFPSNFGLQALTTLRECDGHGRGRAGGGRQSQCSKAYQKDYSSSFCSH
jgi:hypothetical protein